MYPGNVNVADGLIVEEMSVSPITAIVASSGISETVIDAAVVADNRTPVAGMPVVSRAFKSPVTGRPQQVRFGGQHPSLTQTLCSSLGKAWMKKPSFSDRLRNEVRIPLGNKPSP
jgi:hypothetical protein